MKRIILAAVLGLMFITPANAVGPNDVLLSCWVDELGSQTLDKATTIILSPDNNTAEMIDPRNRLQKGDLTVADYFYTITISRNTQFSKVGEIKINRFTGRLSGQWRYPEAEEGKFSKANDIYGTCVKLPNNVFRDF